MILWWLSGCFFGFCLEGCMLPPLRLCACPCLKDCRLQQILDVGVVG